MNTQCVCVHVCEKPTSNVKQLRTDKLKGSRTYLKQYVPSIRSGGVGFREGVGAVILFPYNTQQCPYHQRKQHSILKTFKMKANNED